MERVAKEGKEGKEELESSGLKEIMDESKMGERKDGSEGVSGK